MLEKLTFITAHFHDFTWTELLIERIKSTTPIEAISEIIIIDQDRTEASRERLEKLGNLIKVVQYPKSEKHFAWTRHDHAHVLNKAILEAKGEFILIFDSDAHPVSSRYLDICEQLLEKYDAILAGVPEQPEMTHPCFMLIKSKHQSLNLKFDEGLFKNCTDTGRLIGKQLIDFGENIYICPHQPVFLKKWGSFYLGEIYHHGHGSFHGVTDELLASQLKWENSFFRHIVQSGRYSPSVIEIVKYYGFKTNFYISRFTRKIRHFVVKTSSIF